MLKKIKGMFGPEDSTTEEFEKESLALVKPTPAPVETTFEQLKRGAGGDANRPLTREENRLTRKGKYELDQETRKLTPQGKTARLKYRLNWAMVWLVIGIVLTWLILIFA